MKKYKIKRKKALPGEAISAALIGAGATLAASVANVAAQQAAAKQQADATKRAADISANALRRQNENASNLQERNIAFTKQENELNRDLQRDVQMNLQMLTGQQNANAVAEARRIQVKRGGSVKKKGLQSSLLQGMGNMPFRVTDGGSVIPIGLTPEGYALYEIAGNDHEHYHKAQGGKYKTGVGIKFANGETIEGEGNQNSSKGELLLVTPNDAKFISKHTIKGFNPADAVRQGMHPLAAFEEQELIKGIHGINDAGMNTSSTPVKKMKQRIALNGTMLSQPFMMGIAPNLSTDTLAPTATGVGYTILNNSEDTNKLAKCGKRVRRPLGGGNTFLGVPAYRLFENYGAPQTDIVGLTNYRNNPALGTAINDFANRHIDGKPAPMINPNNTTPTTSPSSSNPSFWDNYGGSIVNAGANLIGAGITSLGNRAANRHMQDAYNDSANAIKEAIGQMRGVDMGVLKRKDFGAAHAWAAVQAPVVSTGAERTGAERDLLRGLSNVRRSTLSSGAAQDRSNRLNTAYQDRIAQIESNANKIRQDIIQGNMARITDMSKTNAMLDTEANQRYAGAYLDLLKYNNDIENTKLMGIADAESNRVMGRAQSVAQTHAANAQGWASALTKSANTYNNNMNVLNHNRFSLDNTLLGASDDAVLRHIFSANPKDSTNIKQARGLWMRYRYGNDDQKRIAKQIQEMYGF